MAAMAGVDQRVITGEMSDIAAAQSDFMAKYNTCSPHIPVYRLVNIIYSYHCSNIWDDYICVTKVYVDNLQ